MWVPALAVTWALLLLNLLVHPTWSRRLPPIYWNSSNPIFLIDNTDHVFTVRIRDKLDLLCPYYDPAALLDPNLKVEYSEIYQVSKSSYEQCKLNAEKKIVGVCQTPFEPGAKITVVFREFTPKPGGLEFTPGQSYYFISTSTGTFEGLSNADGGLCRSQNVKIKFEIMPDSYEGFQGGGEDYADPHEGGHVPPRWGGDESPPPPPDNRLYPHNAQSSSSEGGPGAKAAPLPPANGASSSQSHNGDPLQEPGTDTSIMYVVHAENSKEQQLRPPQDHASYIITEEYWPSGEGQSQERKSGACSLLMQRIRKWPCFILLGLALALLTR